MAAIVTDEDFKLAANQWQGTQVLPAGKSWFQDVPERKILIETPGTPYTYQDVTPAAAVLEAALDTALANNADANLLETAAQVCEEIKAYLVRELRKTPATPVATLFTTIRNMVAANDDLKRAVLNATNLFNAAFGWTVNTDPLAIIAADRDNYITIVWMVVGLPG